MSDLSANAIKDATEKLNMSVNKTMKEKIGGTLNNPYTFTYKLDLNVDEFKITAEQWKKLAEQYNLDSKTDEEPEEWIWVTGYKGTDHDMKCRDYQYELGKLHNMPEGEKIRDCHSGFHLCKELKDVFKYYDIGYGRRYFEVQALVRKKDAEEYGVDMSKFGGYFWYSPITTVRNKLAAKSIVFTRELTIEEILKDTDAADWSPEFKRMAIDKSIPIAQEAVWAKHLTELGYSEAFSEYIADEGEDAYEAAVQVASQKELSMDMKVLAIIRAM